MTVLLWNIWPYYYEIKWPYYNKKMTVLLWIKWPYYYKKMTVFLWDNTVNFDSIIMAIIIRSYGHVLTSEWISSIGIWHIRTNVRGELINWFMTVVYRPPKRACGAETIPANRGTIKKFGSFFLKWPSVVCQQFLLI